MAQGVCDDGPAVIRNASKGTLLATEETWARTPAERLTGLLEHTSLDPGQALMITRCNSIHMFGMRFAIDVAFLKKDGTVVRVIHAIKPGRFTRIHFTASMALELPAGTLEATRTEAGDRLEWDPEG